MKISDLIKMGLRNLFRRKARTALTIIGMVIGTISIVVMSSIGNGINNIFEEAVMKDGSLSKIYVSQNGWDPETGTQIKGVELNDELIEKIREIDNVKNVSPSMGKSLVLKSGKYESWLWVQVIDYGTAKDFGFPNKADGTPLTKEDSDKIIVNKDSLNYFYYWSGRNPKTKSVDLEKDKVFANFQEYQLPEGKKAFTFPVNDKYMFLDAEEGTEYYWNSYIDIDYFKELYTKYANTLKLEDRKKAIKSLNVYEQIIVNVNNIRDAEEVVKKINELGVNSYSNMESLNTMQDTADMLKLVFGAIGMVALIVSAINIANTMIMSIYERTKEIGVMKVLGCLVFDIKKLFLFEAGLIGLIGGLVGIGFSFLASWAVNKYGGPLLSNIIPGNGWYIDSTGAKFSQISVGLTLLAVLVSIGVGVISGFFPAHRATKISAIEAMKTEN